LELTLPVQALAFQFFRFGIIGGIGFVVDTTVLYALLYGPGLDPYSARVPSYLVAATTTWALNRQFTFRPSTGRGLHIEWASFVGACSVGGVVNYAVYAWLISRGAPFATYPVLAVLCGVFAGMFLNFGASKWLVFKN